jgi:hypothetical protein
VFLFAEKNKKMVVLQRIKKPKNKRSVRALEAREPKAIGKAGAFCGLGIDGFVLFFHGKRTFFVSR